MELTSQEKNILQKQIELDGITEKLGALIKERDVLLAEKDNEAQLAKVKIATECNIEIDELKVQKVQSEEEYKSLLRA